MEIKLNKNWACYEPTVTVITPVYNRRKELSRAMLSVTRQTYKDIEYIVVDDGSTIEIDDIVFNFMEKVDFPMMYIKKPNGGVHTARNAAIRNSRGKMIINIDSDDELYPTAIEKMMSVWNSIPKEHRIEYREICARCSDEDGKIIGKPFTKNINDLSWKKAKSEAAKCGGEHIGFWRGDIMRDNPWPEPEGITFVNEDLLWQHLRTKYKSFYVNDVIRIYHNDAESSYIQDIKKLTIQKVKNMIFYSAWALNHRAEDEYPPDRLLKETIRYSVLSHILRRREGKCAYKLRGVLNYVTYGIMFVPSWLYSYKFEQKVE